MLSGVLHTCVMLSDARHHHRHQVCYWFVCKDAGQTGAEKTKVSSSSPSGLLLVFVCTDAGRSNWSGKDQGDVIGCVCMCQHGAPSAAGLPLLDFAGRVPCFDNFLF